MGSVQRERRHYERRQAGGRRAADPSSQLQGTVIKPPVPMPTLSPHRLCRACGSSLIERSRRGPIERMVTWMLRRNAFRCRLCGWRGWLRV